MTAIDTLERPSGTRSVDLPVGGKQGQPRAQIAPVPRFNMAPRHLDVLPRHRPPSISPTWSTTFLGRLQSAHAEVLSDWWCPCLVFEVAAPDVTPHRCSLSPRL